MGFLSLLVVRSILSIYDLVRNYRIATVALKVIVLFLIVFPLMIRLPYQIQYHSQIYHGQTHRVIRMVENSGVGKNALVLISGNPFIFRSFFFQNALIPSSGGRVFVHDKPQLRGEILEAYPRNETWRIEIKLERLPGPNSYSDHFILEEFGSKRLR